MLRSILVLISCCCFAFSASTQTIVPLTTASVQIPNDAAMDQFLEYQLVRMDIEPLYRDWESPDDYLEFQLNTVTETNSFQLYRHDLRRSTYQLTSGNRNDRTFILHPRLPAAQYKGLANEEAGSTAIFTIDENFVLGYWQTDETTTYLEPLWRFWPEAPQDVYILYTETGVEAVVGNCLTESGVHDGDENGGSGRSAIGECFEIEIALAADQELFQQLGNSATAVENFMLNSLALVQTNYDSQAGDGEFEDELSFFVSDTYIATSSASDPWTNSTDPQVLLPEFRTWGNAGNFNANFDVATLWTGRDFNGGTVGLAYVGAVCGFSRYNTCENFSTNSAAIRVLWAHELGHNFDADHDEGTPFNTIMAPSVNITNDWSQVSRNSINAHYQSRTCLANCTQAAPQASFSTSANTICPGAQVAFIDGSTGNVSSRQWSFPGGSPSSSTDANPVITYNNAGNFTATLTVTNAVGSTSTQQQIIVAPDNFQLLVMETFEGQNSDVDVDNPDNSTTWAARSVAGNSGNTAAFLNNFNYQAQGQVDALILPTQDMSNSSNLRLQFEYAYVRFNATFKDQLRVSVVTPSGTTQVFLGDENGSGNFATDPDQTSFFTPTAASDWCFSSPGCIDLDLSQFDGQSSVQVLIENINGFGNSMYVDNIELTAVCTPSNNLPVEWLSFAAKAEESLSKLEWTVNQDEAHAGFHVERAYVNDPTKWEQLDFIEKIGAAAQNVTYTYVDYTVNKGNDYLYRLRQVDVDGSEDLSVIRTVSFAGNGGSSKVWPNPNRGVFTLSTSTTNGQYQVLDLHGQQLLTGRIQSSLTEISIAQLPTGVYWLQVVAGSGEAQTLRVVKQ